VMASPAVRRRRLAAELRAIRESAGESGEEVARALRWSPSKITRYELARTGLRPSDVVRLLDHYGIGGDRRAYLLALAQDAAGKGWWEASGDEIADDVQLYIGFEHEATAIAIWHHNVVPGLLQTAGYARQIIANYSAIEPMPPGLVERLVRVRMRRQQVLTRESPVQICAVLDESILRRRIGDEQVMHDQLTHLAELADRLNIILRILPLDAQHTVLGPAFVTFRFGPPTDALLPDIAASEQLKSIVIVEDERHVHLHRLVFEALDNESLSPAKSSALILEAAESWWSAPRATAIGSEVRRSTRPRDS
jgi:transcriptional regulator with XRE-family HTH domain